MFKIKTILASNSGKLLINIISKVWVVVAGILVVPAYLTYLGKEAYGLISFYAIMNGTLALLDLGLSTALTRQVATYSANESSRYRIGALVSTVEIIYVVIGLIAALIIWLLSPFIALHWLQANSIDTQILRFSIVAMGLLFAVQWPLAVYNGGLIGEGKQDKVALIGIIGVTIKSVIVIPFLAYGFNNLYFFFTWQIIISIIVSLISRYILFQPLIITNRFSKLEFKAIFQFSKGMFSIALITFFLTQLDKLMLSRMVSLEQIGFYNIAFLLGTSVSFFISTLQTVFFPPLTSSLAAGDQSKAQALFKQFMQLIAVLSAITGFFLIFFGKELLLVWTHNNEVANQAYPILITIAIGSMCNSIMVPPYNYMLASGNTSYTFKQNILVTFLSVPLLYVLILNYGTIGAGIVWLLINLGYVIISLPIVNRKFIHTNLFQLYVYDIGIFFLFGSVVLLAIKLGASILGIASNFIFLTTVFVVTAGLYYIAFNSIRTRVNHLVLSFFK